MDLNPKFQIAWRVPDGGRRVTYVSDQVPTFGADCRDLDVTVERDGDVWHVWVDPEYDLTVESAAATVSLDLQHADALFLNGYNSWTDSWERSPRANMHGLWGTPRGIVDHWVLDASGDYRFARQDPRFGHQHGEGYGYLRFGQAVSLFGDCKPDTGLTVIYEDLPENTITLEKEGPNRALAAGERVEVLTLVLVEGTLQGAFSRYVELMGVKRRPALPLVGFTSWYRHYGDIDAATLRRDLVGVSDVLLAQPLEGALPVFQVDDGYAKVGDWTRPDLERFPAGMGAVADDICSAGLVPGLWMAPFVCEKDSHTFAEHQDWLLRDAQGHLVMSGSHWSGGYALDTQNPEVRDYVRTSLSTATRIWGFKLLKLDFLYAAAMVPHAGLNRGELMADALDLLRESVPDNTLFDFCGVPVVSAFGRCEYCRVGCDVGLDWNDTLHMRVTGRERVSTKNSLHNTKGRAHLNGVTFLNDPDVFFLRRDVKITDSQRTRLLSADSLLGGVLFTSDDMGAWDSRQMGIFQNALDTFVRRSRNLVPQGEDHGELETNNDSYDEEEEPDSPSSALNAEVMTSDMTQPMPVVDMTQPMPVADKIDTPPASDQMEVVPESDMTQVMDGLDMTMVDRPLLAAIEAAEREGDSPEESDALRDSDDMPLETEGNSHE